VELQEFSPVQLYSHLGFDSSPMPLIVDKRGEAAQLMREHLELNTLNLEPTAAELTSVNGDEKFRIGLLQIYGQVSAFEDPDKAIQRIRSFLEMAIAFLNPSKVEKLTFRTLSVAPTNSFDELKDILNDRLLGGAGGARIALGADISDSGWVLESESGDATQRLQFGAMRGDQLQGILEMTETFGPPEMLYVLTESRMTVSLASSEILDEWTKAREEHSAFTTRTSSWLGSVTA
jgi:hypothetical protein